MAIARGTSNYQTGASSPATLSLSPSGSDLLLLIGVQNQNGDTNTGITYGSQTPTLLQKQAVSGKGYQYLYYLLAPATGSNTITVTATGGSSIYIMAATYSGVKQVVPEVYNQVTNNSNSITTTVTTSSDNAWVAGFMYNNATAGSVGSGTSQVTGNTYLAFVDSGAAVTPAGSKSLIWTGYSGTPVGLTIAGFAPAPTFNASPLMNMQLSSGGLI